MSLRVKFKKLMSFTLAEVLITLGIIGVVAAMTIPPLINKSNDLELKTAWKKDYSVIANAFNLILSENGGSIKGLCTDNNDGTCFKNLLRDKLNFQKDCPNGTARGNCWVLDSAAKNYLGGSGTANIGTNGNVGLVLNDGTSILIWWTDGTTCNAYSTWKKLCGVVYIDVNGLKSPNTQGKDIFGIEVDENKIFPLGTQGDVVYVYEQGSTNNCTQANNEPNITGLGCSANYLQE